VTQETFLRAWRKRASFQGRSTFRAWLYRIATNACLDALARRPRRVPPPQPPTGADPDVPAPPRSEPPWIQPYPDLLLDGIAPRDAEPDAALVAKETIELAFMVAIQHLPPRSRAVLILRDVLGWSAKETAALLETSVASVNSALQRARAALKVHLPERRLEWAAGADPSAEERALLQRYVEATERADTAALVETLREDVRFTMPPQPEWYAGRDVIVRSWIEGGFGTDAFGAMRCVPTRANRQPAAACYLRRPGESEYVPFALDVLRIEEGRIAEITTFGPGLFPAFGLPPAR
jgi:RNA polymerase sigma-70 factor (ECF subfamily)